MQLVEEGRLGLHAPIAKHLPQPLPSDTSADTVRRCCAFAGIARDERWRRLTPRIPLQFVLEQGLGLDVGAEMQKALARTERQEPHGGTGRPPSRSVHCRA